MKKLISVFLAALCIFTLFTTVASAGGAFDDITLEPEESNIYCIIYTSETLNGVTMMYAPHTQASFNGPGYATVTNDTPIAVDHDFVCWKDGHGRYYYPGDKVYVNGTVHLYAVWEKKTDNNNHVLRVIRAAIASLERVLQKLFGIFKEFKEFDETYVAPTTTTEPISEPETNPDVDPAIGG